MKSFVTFDFVVYLKPILLESCAQHATDLRQIKHVQTRKYLHLEVLIREKFEQPTNSIQSLNFKFKLEKVYVLSFSIIFQLGDEVSFGVNPSPMSTPQLVHIRDARALVRAISMKTSGASLQRPQAPEHSDHGTGRGWKTGQVGPNRVGLVCRAHTMSPNLNLTFS